MPPPRPPDGRAYHSETCWGRFSTRWFPPPSASDRASTRSSRRRTACWGPNGHRSGCTIAAPGPWRWPPPPFPTPRRRRERARKTGRLPPDAACAWSIRRVREANQTVLLAPLRGWRRALGTLVIEGPTFTDEARLLTQIDELARQLSVGVESVQLLEQVLSQRQQLAQSEKLAALGQFVAGIAHEMNNPLQGVLGPSRAAVRT